MNKKEVAAKIKLREQKAEKLLAKTDSVAVKASTKTNQVRKKPDKETLAGTCLGIMISSLMEGPSFV